MTNITGYIVLGLIVLAATGILLISLVQTRIIRQHGIGHFHKRGFINVYWRDRTKSERWCFWVGLVLMSLPFIIGGICYLLSI
jgi:hypothetical protein